MGIFVSGLVKLRPENLYLNTLHNVIIYWGIQGLFLYIKQKRVAFLLLE